MISVFRGAYLFLFPYRDVCGDDHDDPRGGGDHLPHILQRL